MFIRIDDEHRLLRPDLKIKHLHITDFTESSATKFVTDFNEIHDSGQEIIPILIDSYGGGVHSLNVMLDVIDESVKPVATFTLGKAMSCGAILLASGTVGYRYAGKSSRILMHDVSAGARGKLSEMQNSLTEIKELKRLVFKRLHKHTGTDWEAVLNNKNNEDLFLSPQEAKKLNLIDQIGVPKVHIKTSIEFGL
jgi:ATP-dependent Clp protease protease subunit